MSNITFDAIHTQTKQKKLTEMMHQSARVCHEMHNPNPVLNQCSICQSNNINFHVEKFGFRLDRCDDCEQIFCNPMPSHEQLASYYNGPMKEFENQFFADSFENRIPIFSHRINVIHNYVKQGLLLDIGSAIGIFIEALKRSNTELSIHCCEPSADACTRLKQRFPEINLYNNWLQDLPSEEKYDAITLWDTIEHIEDIDIFTQKVFSLLKPGGYWFFSTPNTHSFEWQIAGKDHVQLLPPGHINLFNPNSIEILMHRHGFNISEMQTPNGTLDISYIDKLTQSSNQYDEHLGSFLKTHLQDENFKQQFAQLLSTTTTAGNVFVIARKPA
ncbi:class I SAM-dependent methyltransferase [Paraglaciecola aquimarina]|uniref:Class I SAM-dependent methyltransferase n=1 Tax=Paraglaciecola algarum TaxID=3050085 RepID=A0ABS9D5C0_9ALTE|nr:class I SAM-dependent methyltransferase [Paraglaciecola sp. G1-23]MCF2948110.1 class I SAM-dependent methyltransferase [Paraglaciecola sp. G1-23]